MGEDKPHVSLITTFYNESGSVRRFFEGLRHWTVLPDEIVMVDGGSTDDTVPTIRECIPSAPISVRLIETGGCNISQGRNLAIKNAEFDLIACTDMGCLIAPDWLERILRPLCEDATVDVVGGYYEPIRRTPFQDCYYHLTYKPSLDKSHFLPSSRSIAFRRRVWEEVGGYPEHMTTAEDTAFDLRIRKCGFKEVLAEDARVQWEARDSFSSLFRQYFRYGQGAGSWVVQPLQYGFYWANYVGFVLWAALAWTISPVIGVFLVLHLIWYGYFRIFRKRLVRSNLNPGNLVRYVGITLCVDAGSMFGYALGIMQWLAGRGRQFAPPADRGERYGSYWGGAAGKKMGASSPPLGESKRGLTGQRSERLPKLRTVALMAYLAVANHLVNKIPLNSVRNFLYRRLFLVKLGRGSVIHMGAFVEKPRWITVGDHTLINPDCMLDGRGRLTIGSNVDIAMQVAIFTMAHDINDPDYRPVAAPVVIEDRVSIFSRATVLPGVRIGEGAVVGAGSVVTKDVQPYTVVAGVPAKKIGERSKELKYTLETSRYFH